MYNTEFSLHSALNLERDLENSLQEMLKVKKPSDLTQNLLKQVNKDTIIKVVNALAGALTRSSELLHLAAADVDQLKSDKLRLQDQLLASKDEVLTGKDEQIAEMKTSVKSEFKSWADVVSKTCNSTAVITPKCIKEAVKSAVNEEDRSHNVMVYGVEEGGSNEDDLRQFSDILDEVGLFFGDISVIVERIGEIKEGSVRPIRVRFEKSDFVFKVLSKARLLKNSEKFSSVYLGPDRTIEERKAHRTLVEQLKKKRLENIDRVFFIRNNIVCSKPRQSDRDNAQSIS